MDDINNVTLCGRLGQAPDIRRTQGGTSVANFSIATNRSIKSRSGEWEKKTSWHKIVLWGKAAEWCAEWNKGDSIVVSGYLESKTYVDKSGQNRTQTEIIAGTAYNASRRRDSNHLLTNEPPIECDPEKLNDEDIPF